MSHNDVVAERHRVQEPQLRENKETQWVLRLAHCCGEEEAGRSTQRAPT